MLEQIDMTRKMSKEEFKKRMSILEPELARLQRRFQLFRGRQRSWGYRL